MSKKINLEYRKQVQERAKKIGHCVCSKEFSCPCRWFIDTEICKCAGEGGNFTAKSMKEWIKYNTSDNS